jgi:hypothetical protein
LYSLQINYNFYYFIIREINGYWLFSFINILLFILQIFKEIMQCANKTLLFKDHNQLKQYDEEQEEIFFTPLLKPKKSRKEILESPINLYKTGEDENIFFNSDEESGPHLKMKVYDQMEMTSLVRNIKKVKTIKLIKETAEESTLQIREEKTKDDENAFRFKYTAENPTWDWSEDKNVTILGYMSSKGDKFLLPHDCQDN